MDTGTLIDVVKMIETRLNTLQALPEESDTKHARIYELIMLQGHLQEAIEADVSALENDMGE